MKPFGKRTRSIGTGRTTTRTRARRSSASTCCAAPARRAQHSHSAPQHRPRRQPVAPRRRSSTWSAPSFSFPTCRCLPFDPGSHRHRPRRIGGPIDRDAAQEGTSALTTLTIFPSGAARRPFRDITRKLAARTASPRATVPSRAGAALRRSRANDVSHRNGTRASAARRCSTCSCRISSGTPCSTTRGSSPRSADRPPRSPPIAFRSCDSRGAISSATRSKRSRRAQDLEVVRNDRPSAASLDRAGHRMGQARPRVRPIPRLAPGTAVAPSLRRLQRCAQHGIGRAGRRNDPPDPQNSRTAADPALGAHPRSVPHPRLFFGCGADSAGGLLPAVSSTAWFRVITESSPAKARCSRASSPMR